LARIPIREKNDIFSGIPWQIGELGGKRSFWCGVEDGSEHTLELLLSIFLEAWKTYLSPRKLGGKHCRKNLGCNVRRNRARLEGEGRRPFGFEGGHWIVNERGKGGEEGVA
jgi:hypothetical protein